MVRWIHCDYSLLEAPWSSLLASIDISTPSCPHHRESDFVYHNIEISFNLNRIHKYQKLVVDTLSANNFIFVRTVSVNNFLFAETVSVNNLFQKKRHDVYEKSQGFMRIDF